MFDHKITPVLCAVTKRTSVRLHRVHIELAKAQRKILCSEYMSKYRRGRQVDFKTIRSYFTKKEKQPDINAEHSCKSKKPKK